MDRMDDLILRMTAYERGNPHQIQHSLKVHAFARLIAVGEGLDADTRLTVEAAAVVHDVGIKPAREKYGSSEGRLQELEGPAPAGALMRAAGFGEARTERVRWLVAHHHTCDPVDGIDHRILLEAAFLVNLFEDHSSPDAVRTTLERVFRTHTGTALLKTMFDVE